MHVTVLRHEADVHLGHFAGVLDGLGVNFCYRDLGDPGRLDESSGLLVLGGSMSSNDPLPGLAAELTLIEQALVTGVPVLGICLGAQLIAKAMGARVYRNPQEEIGWAPVHLTEAGRADPIFRGIESPAQFFHWHRDTFDLPANADVLAYSSLCRYQAFRYGQSVYGIQFHPEVTAAMISAWSADPEGSRDPVAFDSPIHPHTFDSGPLARKILEGWLTIAERTIPERPDGPLS
jgi:GMP synthase-like glutamine amidotransferase